MLHVDNRARFAWHPLHATSVMHPPTFVTYLYWPAKARFAKDNHLCVWTRDVGHLGMELVPGVLCMGFFPIQNLST